MWIDELGAKSDCTTYTKRRSTLPNTADDMMPMESTRSWWKRVIGSAINIVKTVMKRVLPVRMYTAVAAKITWNR